MSSTLEEFKRFLDQPSDPIKLLLTQLAPELSQTLSLSAIPHSFDETTISILEPDLDRAALKARMKFLTELSVVVRAGNDLALHDRARRVLFGDWLVERRAEFGAVSRRLADHYLKKSADLPETEREVCQSRGVYHLIGADQGEGIRQLAVMFRESHRSRRTGHCLRLIGLALEYEPILQPAERTTIKLLEGMTAARLNNPADARAAFEIVAERGSPNEQVEALRRAAQVAREDGDLVAGDAYLRSACQLIAQNAIDWPEIVRTQLERGLLLRDQEQIEEAYDTLQEAARWAIEGDLSIERAAALNAIGRNFGRLGDYKAALGYYRAAVEALGEKMMMQRAPILSNLATAAAENQDFALAEQSYSEALAIARASHDVLGEATIDGNLARVFWRSGRKAEATHIATAAAAKFDELGHAERAAMVLLNLARLHRNDGHPDARIHAAQAAFLQRSVGNVAEAREIDQEFAKDLGRRGRWRWWAYTLLIFVAIFILILIFVTALIATESATEV